MKMRTTRAQLIGPAPGIQEGQRGGGGRMPWMIDGHNLIASLPGLSLSDPDDEQRLIALLMAYFGRKRKPATVYFDRRAAGVPNPPTRNMVSARFVAAPRTADDAMRAHLARLGRQAVNWIVVSSDGQIQAAARRAGARVEPSASFARELVAASHAPEHEKPGEDISPDEVRELLQAFRSRPARPRS
jgi:hypothetical protein